MLSSLKLITSQDSVRDNEGEHNEHYKSSNRNYRRWPSWSSCRSTLNRLLVKRRLSLKLALKSQPVCARAMCAFSRRGAGVLIGAAVALLENHGWQHPDPEKLPTGQELVERLSVAPGPNARTAGAKST